MGHFGAAPRVAVGACHGASALAVSYVGNRNVTMNRAPHSGPPSGDAA
jgi:hypothetical protein